MAAAVSLGAGGFLAGPAQASGAGVTVIADHLNGPRELQFAGGKRIVVAESDAGQVTQINARTGAHRVIASGLNVPQGVDVRAGRTYVAQGLRSLPTGEPDLASTAGQDLLAIKGTSRHQVADLRAFELAHNPDGQAQFVNGQPVDSISNPYYILADTSNLLVADAGANDILKVNRKTGRTSVFFVPPTVMDGACETHPENTPGTFGCDSVPTGIAKSKDGTYWISTLGGEVPGGGRLYQVDPTGGVLTIDAGLDAFTGVAVGDDGSVYASQLLYGMPEGPPPADFDPSTIGRILRFAPDGSTWAAAVTMPSGLVFHNGALYASAWSVGAFVGMPNAGQIVKVGDAVWQRVKL